MWWSSAKKRTLCQARHAVSRAPIHPNPRTGKRLDQRQLDFPSPLACLFTVWFPPEPKEGTVMTTDAQVRKLRQFLGEGHPLYRAASKVGMDAKSAREYRHADRLLTESFTPGTWRTREDPFQDVWPPTSRPAGNQSRASSQDPLRRSPASLPRG